MQNMRRYSKLRSTARPALEIITPSSELLRCFFMIIFLNNLFADYLIFYIYFFDRFYYVHIQAAERGEELPPRGERRFCPYSRNKKKEDGSEPGSLSGNGENVNSLNSENQKTVTEELLSKVTPLQLPVTKDADIPTTPEALARTTSSKPDSVCNSSSPSLKSDQ